MPSGQEFDALLESPCEGVIIAKANGQLAMMNEAARNILGIDGFPISCVDELNRLDVHRLDGSQQPADERPLARALCGQGFTECEVLHIRPDGEARRVVSCGTSVKNEGGGVVLAIVVFRDVTELRRLERQRAEYTALISHGLPGPLNTILMTATMLKRSMDEEGRLDGAR